MLLHKIMFLDADEFFASPCRLVHGQLAGTQEDCTRRFMACSYAVFFSVCDSSWIIFNNSLETLLLAKNEVV
jgi:hypothetical protein